MSLSERPPDPHDHPMVAKLEAQLGPWERLPAVCRFQILGFRGRGDPLAAARQALRGVPWAAPDFVKIDRQQNEVVVGVQVMSVNTAPAKAALEQAGFKIGRTSISTGG